MRPFHGKPRTDQDTARPGGAICMFPARVTCDRSLRGLGGEEQVDHRHEPPGDSVGVQHQVVDLRKLHEHLAGFSGASPSAWKGHLTSTKKQKHVPSLPRTPTSICVLSPGKKRKYLCSSEIDSL